MRGKVLCITQDPDRPTTATILGLRDAGFEVVVICPGLKEMVAPLKANNVPVIDMAIPGRFERAETRALRRMIEEGAYQILHLFSNSALESGLRASRGLDTRIVAYRGIVGNVSFFDPVSWSRFLNPRIDRIVCVAECVRDYFLSMRPAFLRIPSERLVTIYKGHDLGWYSAPPADLRSVGIPNNAFVVSCVANYRPRKGIELLVEALSMLPSYCDVHLMLVGRMQAQRLSAKIQASPMRDRIHCLGHRADAPSLTAASDVFVLPSLRREGLSRSLIEAMAYAVAPVASDCGGSPELVIDGESGLLVPSGDASAIAEAVEKLYKDTALRERLGQAARARIRDRFRIEDTIAKTIELYDGLLSD